MKRASARLRLGGRGNAPRRAQELPPGQPALESSADEKYDRSFPYEELRNVGTDETYRVAKVAAAKVAGGRVVHVAIGERICRKLRWTGEGTGRRGKIPVTRTMMCARKRLRAEQGAEGNEEG